MHFHLGNADYVALFEPTASSTELAGKGYQGRAIGEKVGLPGFVAGKYVTQASRFQKEELRETVEACVEAEEAIKTGRLNDNMSVELLIVKYSSNR